mgnify:CR=1 FL=1
MLDPQCQAILALIAASGLKPFHELPPAEARATYQQRRFATQAAPLPVHEVRDLSMPLSGGGAIGLRLYRPVAPSGAPEPALVYFHGGGWVLGDQQSDDPFCRDMCRRTGMIFVSVGYRHAPEHRFPAAAEDGYAATRWIAEPVAGQ